jgi:hypothetical protein
MYIKEGIRCTLSTIMDKSTAGREDLGLEDLRSAIGAFIRDRDWEQFHSPKTTLKAFLKCLPSPTSWKVCSRKSLGTDLAVG